MEEISLDFRTCRNGFDRPALWPEDCPLCPAKGQQSFFFRKAIAVRRVVWLILLLGTLGWLACVLPGSRPVCCRAPDPLGPWRRTAAGWETCTSWTTPAQRQPPPVHPLWAAAVQLAGVVGGTLLVNPRTRTAFPSAAGTPRCISPAS
ncbi:MAG: hypothetical protein JXB10_09785 [Pirellulales bacterium]|nr:hypothetical protein [Pirellulales bacterium]